MKTALITIALAVPMTVLGLFLIIARPGRFCVFLRKQGIPPWQFALSCAVLIAGLLFNSGCASTPTHTVPKPIPVELEE